MTASRMRGVVQLLLAIATMAMLWLGILPRIARWPAVQQRIQRLDAAGINPAAIYYTEHPRHQRWYQRMRDLHTAHPDHF